MSRAERTASTNSGTVLDRRTDTVSGGAQNPIGAVQERYGRDRDLFGVATAVEIERWGRSGARQELKATLGPHGGSSRLTRQATLDEMGPGPAHAGRQQPAHWALSTRRAGRSSGRGTLQVVKRYRDCAAQSTQLGLAYRQEAGPMRAGPLALITHPQGQAWPRWHHRWQEP